MRARLSETAYDVAAARRSYSRSSSHWSTSHVVSALTPRSLGAIRSPSDPRLWRDNTTISASAGSSVAATASTRICFLMLSRCSARSDRPMISSHLPTGTVLEDYSKIHLPTGAASELAHEWSRHAELARCLGEEPLTRGGR